MRTDLQTLSSILHFGGPLLGRQYVIPSENPLVNKTIDFPFEGFEKTEFSTKSSYQMLYNTTKNFLINLKKKAIGFPLSGGIDSSTMLYIIQEINKKENLNLKVTAYNQIFNERDESIFAQQIADQTETELKVINQTTESNLKLINDLLKKMPDPIMGNLHIYALSKLMKKDGCNVEISSLGGDECWGGYPPHRLFHSHLFDKNNYTKQNIRTKILRGFLAPINKQGFWRIYNMRFNSLTPFLNQKYHKKFTKSYANNIKSYLNNSRYIKHYYDNIEKKALDERSGKLSFWEANEYLTFIKCDKIYKHQIFTLGSLTDLEVYFPYLERDYVKYALSLDKSIKIKNGISKWGMRQMMKGKISKDLLMRGAYGDKLGWGETYQTLWNTGYKEFVEGKLTKQNVSDYKILNWNLIDKTFKKLTRRYRGAEARILISMSYFQTILELHEKKE